MNRGKEHIGTIRQADLDDPRLRMEVVTPATLLPGEKPLRANERRVIVHPRPIWYVDASDVVQAVGESVESATEDRKSVWRADANTIKFRVDEDGVCSYKAAGHLLRVRPNRIHVESNIGTESEARAQVKPTRTDTASNRVTQSGSFPGVRIEHIVQGGSIKEIAWLDNKPTGLGTSRFFALMYQYTSDTLTPTTVGKDVHWQAGGKTIMRWPAPVVTDAAGDELIARYRVGDGVVGVLISSDALRKATYPVAVDPTTTTGSGDVTATRTTRSSGSSGSATYKQMFNLVTLPDLTGDYFVSAEIQVYCNNSAGAVDVDVRAAATAAWDNTTGYVALEALATGTAISSGLSIGSAVGWKYIDITGNASKGATKFYADDISGGDITIAVDWADWADTLSTESTSGRIGDSGGIQKYGIYSDATYYPRVEVTYSSTPPVDATADPGAIALGNAMVSGTVYQDATATGAILLGGPVVQGASAPPAVASSNLELDGPVVSGTVFSDAWATGAIPLDSPVVLGFGGDDGGEAVGAIPLDDVVVSGYVSSGSITPTGISADSLVWHLTGAAADGDTQREQAYSLGGYRSGQKVRSMTWDWNAPMVGIEIVSIGTANGPGLGSLEAVTRDSITWRPPSGTTGTAVVIANGEEKVVYGGTTGAWIRVRRVSEIQLVGVHAVQCIDIYNNTIGFDNVPSADAVAGEVYYRAVIGKNPTNTNILNSQVWIDTSTDGDIAIAFEALSSGYIQTIANETTAPTGLTWSTATTALTGIQLPMILPGASIGLWIRRTVDASSLPSPSQLVRINYKFSDGLDIYESALRGRYRVIRDDYVMEGVWAGQNAEPDLSATPDETWTSRPHTTSLSLATGNTYHCVIRERNKFGLWSQNTESTKLILNAAGGTDPIPPTAPSETSIYQNSSDEAIIAARYEPAGDTDRAEVFVIWHTDDDSTPSTAGTPTGFQVMDGRIGIESLTFTDTGNTLLDGTPVKAIVRTRRVVVGAGDAFSPDTTQLPASGAGTIVVATELTGWASTGFAKSVKASGLLMEVFEYDSLVVGSGISTFTVLSGGRAQWGTPASATTSSTMVYPVTAQDSTNTDVTEYTMDGLAPGRAWGDLLFGVKGVQEQTPIAGPDGTTKEYIDTPDNIYLLLGEGWVEFWIDTVLVWKCFYDSNNNEAQRIYIPSAWDLVEGTVTGATAGSTVLEATTATDVYIVSRDVRKAHIDATAMTITASEFWSIGGLPEVAPQASSWEQYSGSLLQVWDTAKADCRPYAQLTSEGELKFETDVDNSLTQAQIVAL